MYFVPVAPQKHRVFREKVRDVKALGFEPFVDGVARIPKSQVIRQGLHLVVGNDRIHVLRSCRCCWRIIKAQPDSASPVKDEMNLMVKSFVQREVQTFRVGGNRTHAATGWRGRSTA